MEKFLGQSSTFQKITVQKAQLTAPSINEHRKLGAKLKIFEFLNRFGYFGTQIHSGQIL